MALFDRETDPAKERDGVALDFGDHRVTLARIGHAFNLELEKALRPHRAAIAAGVFDEKQRERIVFGVFARTIVKKWETLALTIKGLTNEVEVSPDGFVRGIDMRGVLVPDTEANIVAVYSAIHSVFLDHNEAARGDRLYRLEQRKDDAGN